MSIDETIQKLLTSMADLAASNRANAEATDRNTAITERVVANQEKAIADMEANRAGGTATTRRPRAKAGETAAADAAPPPATEIAHPLLATPNGEMKQVENPKTKALEDSPTANYRAADFSRDQVKNEFIGWLGETDDKDERAARAAFVGSIGQHFGVKQPFHPSEGLTDDEQRKQTLFFLRRKREGLKVDFGAEYDFDGDPLADQTVEAEVEDEPEDALG